MTVTIKFWSYFKDHTGCSETTLELPESAGSSNVVSEQPVWSLK